MKGLKIVTHFYLRGNSGDKTSHKQHEKTTQRRIDVIKVF